jgi:hypothetical protein
MKSNEREEFYVGYLPKAPQGIAALSRRVVIVLLILAVAAALIAVFGQQSFAPSFFDFGNEREFEGVVNEYPHPILIAQKNLPAGMPPEFSYYALVAPGKHGAEKIVEGFDSRLVKLRGTLIHRDGTAMIEVVPDSVEIVSLRPPAGNRPVEQLGTHTLAGEIVDSKCYLGVMNPGHTKPHRECASLCIRGGIPPLFVVRDAEGRSVSLWLVSDRGVPVNDRVLDFVAEPVEITGHISRTGDQLLFRADPATIRPIR